MISHLGMKPVRGGSPARESRVRSNIAFSEGVFVHEVISVESLGALIVFRIRNVAEVIIA